MERFSDRDLCFSTSYGTAKSGVGICAVSVLRPDTMIKNVIPVIMAGIIAVRRLAEVNALTRSHQHIADLRSRRLRLDLWRP